jgi:8-oxo-dGTP diphosphatase
VSASSGANAIPVVAAVVVRDGHVLLCQRHDGEHLPLLWEFPGGKIDPGETPREALARELDEELGVRSEVGDQVAEILHRYPEKTVWLRFFRASIVGEPRPIVHRAIEWVALERASEYPAPPPNARVIERLVRGELQIH